MANVWIPLTPINPAAPSPWDDKGGNLTIPARSLMNLITRLYNQLANSGFTGTVVLGKITGGGVNGSAVYQNGILITVVEPT
jgi:hypothetical protein